MDVLLAYNPFGNRNDAAAIRAEVLGGSAGDLSKRPKRAKPHASSAAALAGSDYGSSSGIPGIGNGSSSSSNLLYSRDPDRGLHSYLAGGGSSSTSNNGSSSSAAAAAAAAAASHAYSTSSSSGQQQQLAFSAALNGGGSSSSEGGGSGGGSSHGPSRPGSGSGSGAANGFPHHHHHHHSPAAGGGGGSGSSSAAGAAGGGSSSTSMLLSPRNAPSPDSGSGGSVGLASAAAAAAASVLRFNIVGGGGGGAGVGSALGSSSLGAGAAGVHISSSSGIISGSSSYHNVSHSHLPKYGGLKKGVNSTLIDLTNMCKRLWLLAWPLSWMEVLTFTKELIITSYVGHLGASELSALVLAQTVYNVTGNAPMLGFVTAMETFCGQAFGARRYSMVGVVLQRGLAISFLYCCTACAMWAWCEQLLVYMGQDPHISAAASRFTLALAPALFMDAADQCCRRYLSAQAVVQPLMMVTLIATMLTPLFLWLFVAKCGLGLLGAAIAWDAVQATSLALMVTCCVLHTRGQAASRSTWLGWSGEAFQEWPLYIRMAIPSCVMICLDWWTFEVIVMLSGLLPNPEQTMSMMGITFNIHALCFFAAHGLSGAASTRVGNDLGGGRPHMAWLTVQVAVLMGTLVMCASSGLLLLSRHQLGRLFSSEADVVMLTAQAVPPLAVSLIGEGANTVLAGVMRGCGRQKIGASINLVTYWVFGLPIACLLAFPGKLGALGLWTGLACTASIQALIMSLTVFRFNWSDEAARAKALVAAGELVLEDEEPLELINNGYNSDDDDGDIGGAGGGSNGSSYNADKDHPHHQQQQQQQQHHNVFTDGSSGWSSSREGPGGKGSSFQIKAVGGSELSRLLP